MVAPAPWKGYQTSARLARDPVKPVISTMASLVAEKPAVASFMARKVRVPAVSAKEKVTARLAAKEVAVRSAEIPVRSKVLTAPSSLRFLALTAVGAFSLSVPMAKSVMRS